MINQTWGLPLPKWLIWDIYGPCMDLIWDNLWSIYGLYMALIWYITFHIKPIFCHVRLYFASPLSSVWERYVFRKNPYYSHIWE